MTGEVTLRGDVLVVCGMGCLAVRRAFPFSVFLVTVVANLELKAGMSLLADGGLRVRWPEHGRDPEQFHELARDHLRLLRLQRAHWQQHRSQDE